MSESEEKQSREEEIKDLILEARILTMRGTKGGPRFLWESLDLFRWTLTLKDNIKDEDLKELTEAMDKLADMNPESEEFKTTLINVSNKEFTDLWKKYRGFKTQ